MDCWEEFCAQISLTSTLTSVIPTAKLAFKLFICIVEVAPANV